MKPAVKVVSMKTATTHKQKTLNKTDGLKNKAHSLKAKVKDITHSMKSKITRLTGIKKWEYDMKNIEKSHDLLVDYYRNTEFNDIEYGAFGVIDLKKLKKTNHEKLLAKLSEKKYDKDHIKAAFKALKIKSVEVKNKTHDEITKRIGIAFRSLNMILKNKIEDHKEKQKLKLAKKSSKIDVRKAKKAIPIMRYAFKSN